MTAAVTSLPGTGPAGRAQGGTLLRSSRGLALRGLRSIRRLPSAFFPALAMPIFQTIAFSGTFFAVTKIPGFPDRPLGQLVPATGLLHGLWICRGRPRLQHRARHRERLLRPAAHGAGTDDRR